MNKALFSLILSITFLASLKAQSPWCGVHSHTHSKNHLSNAKNDSFEKAYLKNIETFSLKSANKKETKYIIPVVFHIIHQGGRENVNDAEIKGLVKQVNNDLALRNSDTNTIRKIFKDVAADCQIELRLAKKDENQNCTNGITRTFSGKTEDVRDYGGNDVKSLIKWNNKRYLNIWVVKSILSSGEGITLGYAYYPGTGGSNDGIVMRYDQMSSNTLTHELGHYLNLKHTFDDGCFAGDNVEDTPPAAEANFGCPKARNSCSNDLPDLPDQVENYMDNSDCTAMFTQGQKIRMHTAIESYRSTLVSNSNLDFTGVSSEFVETKPIADFAASKQLICQGTEIDFEFTGCDHSINPTFDWQITGPQSFSSNIKNPTFKFDSAGVFDVEITVTNALGGSTKKLKSFVWVIDQTNIIRQSYSRSFNGLPSLPTDYQFINQPNNFGWQLSDNGIDASTCLFVSNFTKGKPSYRASFVLPAINIENLDDQKLRFNLAHAKIDDASNDQFNVLVSLDCGATWRLISSETSKRLTTASNQNKNFVPNQNQWTEKTIDLSRFKSYDLLVKFEFISKNGNNIYIDNIRIGTTETGINLKNNDLHLNLYPNPANQNQPVILQTHKSLIGAQFKINNTSGQTIYSARLQSANHILNKPLEPGIYIINIRHKTEAINLNYKFIKN
ncbi:MAG: M43 family zinc metalloprotease [Bacteroidia bacterium]